MRFVGEDDLTTELVEEGRQLIARERGYLDRVARRSERRRELENMGVYPRSEDSQTGGSSDASARQRSNYMQPTGATSINDDAELGQPAPLGANNDRSQLLTIDLPSYTTGSAAGSAGR